MDEPAYKPVGDDRATESLNNSAKHDLVIGQLIDGRYKLLSLIGRGGMGAVYKVEQVYLHKEFALKTLAPGSISPKALMRFQSEGKTTSALDHPGLAKVRDFGLVGASQPFLVMDYIEGESLAVRVRRIGHLSLANALPILVQVAEALDYAHKHGVLHRDLKPANIMLTVRNGQQAALIVDFGIAKLLNTYDNDLPSLTQTGEIFGSPLYMSPEQCAGTALDARSDAYSFGCLMFETLTGSPPFFGGNPLSTMLKHQSEAPPTLREATLGAEFPADVERVVARLLKKNPDERYQDMADVADHLQRIINKTRVYADSTVPSVKPSERTSVFVERSPSRKSGTLALAIAAGLAIAVISVASVLQISSLTNQLKEVKAQLAAHNVLVEPQYFSSVDQADRSVRVFDFPKKSIGFMDSGKTKVKCEGRVTVRGFEPGCLKLNMFSALVENPAILNRFREDEIGTLNISQEKFGSVAVAAVGTTQDKILQYVDHLKSLQELNVSKANVGNASVEFIGRIERLSILCVSSTQIDGNELARLPQLKNLTKLDVSHTENVGTMLRALTRSTNLHDLDLGWDDIQEQDVETISTLPNLRRLVLEYTGINPKWLGYLRGLKNLRELDAAGLHLKSDDPLVQALPHVKVTGAYPDDELRKAKVEESKEPLKDALKYLRLE